MTKHFKWFVAALCCSYLLLQVRYIVSLPLVMDEFANAGHIQRLTGGVPYRDYVPYKTVLGYCLLLPALVSSASIWTSMLLVKVEIAALTSVALGATAWRLRRHFAAPAILGALLLLCTQSTFLERASELRVDTLAALCGLISLLAYLERRGVLAGVGAGAAVLMTQKGAYFVLCLAAAALFRLVRERSRPALVELAEVGGGAAAVVATYAALGCGIGGPGPFWQSVFVGPQRIAFEPLYASLSAFWFQTLERNPIFYAVGLAGVVLLAPRWRAARDTASQRLWAYAIALTALCLWHKQPWPYFFVILIPTVWVLGAATLDRCAGSARWWSIALGVMVVTASVVSLATRVPVVLSRSATAQRRVVEAATAYLGAGDTYLAGTELFWRHRHMALLSWLDQPRLAAVAHDPGPALAELRAHPPRLLVDNYRLDRLPPVLRDALQVSYAAVGGNLIVYAPQLPEAGAAVSFAYGGLYRVIGEGRVRVDDGRWIASGETISLAAGSHRAEASGGARLASWCDAAAFVEQTERPLTRLFDQVYTY